MRDAFASHQARSHHKERLSGRYVKDGNCPFCGAFFHTRVRAMHHVDFCSKTCKARLLSSPGLPELTEEAIALARQQDRLDYAAAKARGVWRNAGPPACPPLGGWTENTTSLEFSFWFRVFCSILRSCRFLCTCLLPCRFLALFFGHLFALSLPKHRRISCLSASQNGPALPDGFIEWVVLREARSLRFTWS